MKNLLTAVRRNGVQTVVLLVTALALLLPLAGAALFGFREPDGSLTFSQVEAAVSNRQFADQLVLTVSLAVFTALGLYVLLIPTLIWLHLRLPRALPLAEGLSILPLVVPPIALVSGANLTFRPLFPAFLTLEYSLVPFYVILAMPLVYRSVDAGLRAVDLPVLFSAATSLGASWPRTVLTVVLPNLKPALVTGGLLATTLVLGEFVLAQLLLHNTFPVFLEGLGRNAPRAAAAMAFIVIVTTWVLLTAFTGAGRRRSSAAEAIGTATSSATSKGSS
jgi:putative spermidine/putrescine transport system permease protein